MRKRTAVVTAFLLLCGSYTVTEAATLRPTDQDGLNLRAGPGLEHAIIGGLSYHDEATVLGRSGEWYRILTRDGTEAWVAAQYSRVLLEDELRYAVVDTDILNVRREPNLDAPVLTRLVQGEYVRLLEMIPGWWRVRLSDGTEGWVAQEYMRQAAAPPEGGTVPGTGTPPVNPPETPVDPALLPPPAPAGTVPDLGFAPPQELTPLPGKAVVVRVETGVYAGPNSEARRVDTVRPGEELQLLDASGGWVRAVTPRGKKGWIPGSLVQVVDGPYRVAMAERSWRLETATQAPEPAAVGDGTFAIVTDPEGLNLRLIPVTSGRVLTVLPEGEILEVLQRDREWLRVQTAAGETGWVHSDYTAPYDPLGGSGQGAGPAPDEGAGPDAGTVQASFAVQVEEPFTGATRLSVKADVAVGEPVREGGTLLIPFATGEAKERSLPVNILGVRQITLTPEGIRAELSGAPAVTVERSGSGEVAVIIRPVLEAVAQEAVDGKQVFRFRIRGEALPAARAEGSSVVVEIPGAVAEGPVEGPGFTLAAGERGVRVSIPSNRAYAMKRSDDGFYLVLYPPGLAGKVILLDPGHGGDDPGAVSHAVGVVEEEINLQVALRLRALLEGAGAQVYMTRAEDRRAAPEEFLSAVPDEPRDQLDMQYRTMIANKMKVDVFLSIHHNSGEPGAQGTETYYTESTLNGERSRRLAQLVQTEVTAAVGTLNRGAKRDTFYVTRNTDAPAALVELGFVNNPVEGVRTKDPAFQEAVAGALLRALEGLFAERW